MFKKFFIPADDSDITSMALAVLRVWLGLTMFFNHGLGKLAAFNDTVANFPDPLGIGQEASVMLVIFAEVAGALLLAVGFLTRIAALTLVIDMFVAFLMVHKTALNGQGSGELAFLYLAGFVTILIAGGGTFSTDMVMFGKKSARKPAAQN